MGVRKRPLMYIILLALLLRIIFYILVCSYNVTFFIQPDTPSYLGPAVNMLDYHSFLQGRPPMLRYEVIRTPGYPLFIAGIYWLVGKRDVRYVILFQILIGVVLVGIIYLVAREIGGRKAGIYASLISAINPSLIIFNNKALTESLFSFILVIALWLIVSFIRKARDSSGSPLPSLVLGAVMLSVSYFIRPITLYLWIALLPVIFISVRKWKGLKKTLIYSVCFILISFLPGWLWSYRNYRLTGYKSFSAVRARNLLYYNAAAALALRYHVPRKMIDEDLRAHIEKECRDMRYGDRYNVMEAEAMKIIKNNLYYAVYIQVKGIFAMWISNRSPDILLAIGKIKKYPDFGKVFFSTTFLKFVKYVWFHYRNILVLYVLTGLFYLFEYVFSIISLFRYRKEAWMWAIIIVIVYLSALGGGFVGCARFRAPIEPILSILAGLGINIVMSKQFFSIDVS